MAFIVAIEMSHSSALIYAGQALHKLMRLRAGVIGFDPYEIVDRIAASASIDSCS
jgi:hypothetical protein